MPIAPTQQFLNTTNPFIFYFYKKQIGMKKYLIFLIFIGLVFTLTTKLLEYLHNRDLAQPMAYHSIEPFFDSLDDSLSEFTIEDVKFIVNLLSKEFELKFNSKSSST